MFKDGHYTDYKENLLKHCTEFLDNVIFTKIKDYYVGALSQYLSDLNTGIFDVYVAILNKLSAIFNKTGELIVEGKTEAVATGRVFSWNLVETPKILPMLDEMIDNYQMDNILDKFLNDMIDRSQNWIEGDSESVMQEIENFIQVEFTDIVGASMDTILKEYNLSRDVYKRQFLCRTVRKGKQHPICRIGIRCGRIPANSF